MAPRKTIDLTRFHSLCRQDMANILGIAPATIRGYVERGAPQNQDGTYDLPAFVNHIITKRQRGREGDNPDVDRAIKEEQLEKLKLQNELKRGEVVPRQMVDEILGSRALSAATHFRQSLKENVHAMVMKKSEELYPLMDEIAIRTMEVYIGDKKGG
jgi:hypothetical protein